MDFEEFKQEIKDINVGELIELIKNNDIPDIIRYFLLEFLRIIFVIVYLSNPLELNPVLVYIIIPLLFYMYFIWYLSTHFNVPQLPSS